MLNPWEQRVLREIEQGLQADDPGLAARMRQHDHAPSRWARRGFDAVVVFAAALAVLCVALGEAGAGFVAALVGIAVLLWRRHRFPPRAGRWLLRLLRRTGRRPADNDGGTLTA